MAWSDALAFVWRPENDGQGFHLDPHDPGLGTNKGVIQATWAAAVAQGLVAGALAYASDDDLANILFVDFWQRLGCDEMSPGVALVVFNMGMVAGTGRAGRILQRAVGAKEDGIVGRETQAATAVQWAPGLITRLTTADETFFAGLDTAKYFLPGWTRRAEDAKVAAWKLLQGSNSAGGIGGTDTGIGDGGTGASDTPVPA